MQAVYCSWHSKQHELAISLPSPHVVRGHCSKAVCYINILRRYFEIYRSAMNKCLLTLCCVMYKIMDHLQLSPLQGVHDTLYFHVFINSSYIEWISFGVSAVLAAEHLHLTGIKIGVNGKRKARGKLSRCPTSTPQHFWDHQLSLTLIAATLLVCDYSCFQRQTGWERSRVKIGSHFLHFLANNWGCFPGLLARKQGFFRVRGAHTHAFSCYMHCLCDFLSVSKSGDNREKIRGSSPLLCLLWGLHLLSSLPAIVNCTLSSGELAFVFCLEF